MIILKNDERFGFYFLVASFVLCVCESASLLYFSFLLLLIKTENNGAFLELLPICKTTKRLHTVHLKQCNVKLEEEISLSAPHPPPPILSL